MNDPYDPAWRRPDFPAAPLRLFADRVGDAAAIGLDLAATTAFGAAVRCECVVTAEKFAMGTLTDSVTGRAEFVATPQAIAVHADHDWWLRRDPTKCSALADRWIRPNQGVAFPVEITSEFNPSHLAGRLHAMAADAAVDEDAFDPDEYVDVDEHIEDFGKVEIVAGGWKTTLTATQPHQVSHDSVLMPFGLGGVIGPEESEPDRHYNSVRCAIRSFAEDAAAVRAAVLAVMPEDTAANPPAPDPTPARKPRRRPTRHEWGTGRPQPYEDMASRLDSAAAVRVSATAIDDAWRSTRCDCTVTRDRHAIGTLTDKSSGHAEFAITPDAMIVRGNESWWADRSPEHTSAVPDTWIGSPDSIGFDLDIVDTFNPARLAELFRLLRTCAEVEWQPDEDDVDDPDEYIGGTPMIRARAGSWTALHYFDGPGAGWRGWAMAPIRSSTLVPPGNDVPHRHRGWIVFRIEDVAADAAAAHATATRALEEHHGM